MNNSRKLRASLPQQKTIRKLVSCRYIIEYKAKPNHRILNESKPLEFSVVTTGGAGDDGITGTIEWIGGFRVQFTKFLQCIN